MEVVNKDIEYSEMKILKKPIVPLFFVLVVLVTVIIRSTGTDHFLTDARQQALPSFGHSIIISTDQVRQITGNKLFVFLDEGINMDNNYRLRGEILWIPADSLLKNENRRKILGHSGIVLLASADPAVSARIWMILSQMGRKDMFIVAADDEPEVLKYEFQPDTLTTLEF
jgi:hypothetical protein